jgi:hypothetical protein
MANVRVKLVQILMATANPTRYFRSSENKLTSASEPSRCSNPGESIAQRRGNRSNRRTASRLAVLKNSGDDREAATGPLHACDMPPRESMIVLVAVGA